MLLLGGVFLLRKFQFFCGAEYKIQPLQIYWMIQVLLVVTGIPKPSTSSCEKVIGKAAIRLSDGCAFWVTRRLSLLSDVLMIDLYYVSVLVIRVVLFVANCLCDLLRGEVVCFFMGGIVVFAIVAIVLEILV